MIDLGERSFMRGFLIIMALIFMVHFWWIPLTLVLIFVTLVVCGIVGTIGKDFYDRWLTSHHNHYWDDDEDEDNRRP